MWVRLVAASICQADQVRSRNVPTLPESVTAATRMLSVESVSRAAMLAAGTGRVMSKGRLVDRRCGIC